ncbi:MAG: 30S ribosomal protein S20 [Bacillota bacterium]|nr:30S ribosomal protein S20 [Bacillota bacterium]
MAKNRSAMKKARLAKIRTLRNASQKSAMKTAVKRFEDALAAGDQTKIEATFKTATRLIDKVASKGVIHPNSRDRKKAQLARRLKTISES